MIGPVSESGPRDQPPFRLMVAGVGAGVVLIVLGVFVSYLLVGAGAALIALTPLAYAARQVGRHATYTPERKHDASYIADVSRWIERSGRSAADRHRRRDS